MKKFLSSSVRARIPQVHEEDFSTGNILGQGSFNDIIEVKSLSKTASKLSETSSCYTEEEKVEVEEANSRVEIVIKKDLLEDDRSGDALATLNGVEIFPYGYAIKKVRKDLSDQDRAEAYLDLAKEAEFLSALKHENVITLHAMGELGDLSPFLLLERISGDLTEKYWTWRAKKEDLKRQMFNRQAMAVFWDERLEVAKDLTNVMIHIHKSDIIYRDLKPGNCGWNVDGTFKLFDFGLSTYLTPEKRISKDQYILTGTIGTIRFMAPEVFKCMPYGKSADVYSFALILWEILAVRKCFEASSDDLHVRRTFGPSNHRPRVKSSWPKKLKEVLEKCWSADVSERLSFEEIKPCLEECHMSS